MGIRVLVVDEQSIARAGLKVLLEAGHDCEVVAEAADCPTAVTLCREINPDVVLIDVNMSQGDGIAATAAIAGSAGQLPHVLVLTSIDNADCVFDSLRAGASGFLLKRSSGERILDAVRTVNEGGMPLDPLITRRLVDSCLRLTPSACFGGSTGLGTLSERESQIVALIAQGFSTSEVAAALHLSVATVKTHVGHILTKWEVRDRVQLVARAYESGFLSHSGCRPV